MRWRLLGHSTLLLCCVGCVSSQPSPRYPTLNPQRGLALLTQKANALKTVAASGLLTLQQGRESVRLDVALALQSPDHLRLRAWKMGEPVFDLTITPSGVWLEGSQHEPHRQASALAGASASELGRTLLLLSGRFFEQPDLSTSQRGNTFLVRHQEADGVTVQGCVALPQLQPSSYRVSDGAGKTRFFVKLDGYVEQNGACWPRQCTAWSDRGTVEVDLDQVEINRPLPATAFVPPRRAERLK